MLQADLNTGLELTNDIALLTAAIADIGSESLDTYEKKIYAIEQCFLKLRDNLQSVTSMDAIKADIDTFLTTLVTTITTARTSLQTAFDELGPEQEP